MASGDSLSMDHVNGTNGVNGTSGINGVNGTKGVNRTNGVNGTARVNGKNTSHSVQFSNPGANSVKSWPLSIHEQNDTERAIDGIPGRIKHIDRSHRINSFGPHQRELAGPQSSAYAKIHSYKDDPDKQEFPRISKPVELMRNAYDVVVIGSGYGGGVAASRMARADQSVCLLERGKEKWPGEYPSGFIDAMQELHVSGNFSPGFLSGQVEGGDPTGMYHLMMGKGQNAFVGNGLGGTSLLNANIFLEADEETLKTKCWPEELRKPNELKKYYNRAKDVLQPEPYPEDWPALPKLTMLEKQAEALGLGNKFYRPPQTTRFMGGPNSTGVEMYPSALTGMDSTGVNDGSKSSTLVNYLADAWNWGAEMFCECEVRYIKKHPKEGYLVFYAWHGSKRGAFQKNLYEDLMWVYAKKCVFLGAGALGSTEILLRSKKLGLKMSDRVGTGMSGNGDMLAFGYNTNDQVNAIGRSYPSPYNPVGPTITGIIDNRLGHENYLNGYIIEEGAVPKALAPLFQAMLEMMPGNQFPTGQTFSEKVKHMLAQQGSRFLGPYYKNGSIEKTQVYLIMSHDSNQAVLSLEKDKPVLEFLGVGRSNHVQFLNEQLRKATQAVGGTFVQNPFYAALGQQEITVHPIGGACLARDGSAETGVTNHIGEVFSDNNTTKTYPGLVVCDGALIPTALAANPFATITALAERSVEYAAENIHATIDFTTKNKTLDLFGDPQYPLEERVSRNNMDSMKTADLDDEEKKISIAKTLIEETRLTQASGYGFSEIMSGYIHVGDGLVGSKREDYETAAKTARGLCESARFFLSVKAWDTEMIVSRPDHSAMLTGTFVCAALPGSPFMVQRGDFQLFNLYPGSSGTKNLTYDFDMRSVNGEILHFHGYKIVDSSVALGPFKFWQAASTLYVTITKKDKTVLGRGMLHITARDFLSEVFTLMPTGRNLLARLASTTRFMTYFAKQSANLFFTPFTYLQYPSVTYNGYINDTPPDRSYKIRASDGVHTLMHMWEPQNPNIETKNLFFIPGASVDHQIFALPTIQVNAINYFTRAGYRVFVTVHRICQLMVAENNWTTFDSRLDIRACLEYIREHTDNGHEKIYTVAHCMGAVAYSCGLLDGTIPTSWILGISCSQVFMNPMWSALNMAKVMFGPIPFDKLYKMFGGSWFSCSSSKDDSYFQQFLNQLLRFYPVTRSELCNNVSCHRCSLVFGRLWNHRNLNEATHRQINRFFGGVNLTLLNLLMQMGYKGHVTTNVPLCIELDTPSNIRRLSGIPMLFFSGADNKVLTPESTDRSYSILRDMFGEEDYRRVVVPGYGHLDCWMGRDAYKDVYPMIREEIDRVTRGDAYKYREPDWKDWDSWKPFPEQRIGSPPPFSDSSFDGSLN
ncbi:FAD protein [Coleophoma crateriformis]|uniref:FAD protein n=1 Tax=Coleophoma crateriformis TaxID=565419 RepID=A0A3D8SLX5_9HELO|nr:FAD protein [Coleophoma crateriformis]